MVVTYIDGGGCDATDDGGGGCDDSRDRWW